jgi:Glycosyltransferases involved in cell wall biogenesis
MIPFFSILIPAYNVESYIIECLDSIIQQTFLDWECIVINDGSTDKTEQICHKYAKMDMRIKVFHQENIGVAATRNRLINKSSGKYFIFMDGDDWWNEKDMLKDIYEYIQKYNLDIVAWGAFFYNNKTGKKKKTTERIPKETCRTQTGEEYIQCMLENSKNFTWWLFLYAISKKIWIECNARFTPNRVVCEDQEILYKIILSAKRMQRINKEFYNYL